jgi:MFS family permease/quinol monooxygenase YgiN
MSTAPPAAPPAAPAAAWAPLRLRVFRAVWAAQLASAIGTWMQTVGAQWLLVDEPHAETLVALVQTATALPFVLVGLPAGVLADVFDRRRYLLSVHAMLVATAALMAALTFADAMSPALLLTLTFLLGTGTALSLPAWQAIVPSLVPRAELPAASALAGINQNVGRAVGPAIAGVVVASLGAGAVFALNAASFLAGMAVLRRWHPPRPAESALGRERIGPALRAGTRYVWHAPIVRRLLLHLVLFVAPAAALWALLPVVAIDRLGLGSSGYGLLLAALGVGAIGGAVARPRFRRALSPTALAAASAVVYALALAVTGLVTDVAAVACVLVAAGAAWLSVIVTIAASMQLILPGWVRARGLAVYQLVFMGSQAGAAFAWGLLAGQAGLPATLLCAAGVLAVAAATIVRRPLLDMSGLDRTPVAPWPEPALAVDPDPDAGPVAVTVTYTVPAENADAFRAAMARVGRSRRRTGAVSWQLYRDGELPERFVEVWVVATWGEHLRQHEGRLTGADQRFEQEAAALADGEPEVAHLFPPDTPPVPDS